jgi:hypothetical protein
MYNIVLLHYSGGVFKFGFVPKPVYIVTLDFEVIF